MERNPVSGRDGRKFEITGVNGEATQRRCSC